MNDAAAPARGAGTTRTHAWRGVAMVLLAALCWGTTGTAQSFAPPTLSPYWVGALRLVVSALFLATCARWTRSGGRDTLDWRLVAVAGIGMAAYNLAFFAGVRASGIAVGTAVALGSGPIWAGLLQALGGQRPAARWWLGTLLAIAGGVAMVLGAGSAGQAPSVSGIVLCLIAGLSYAAYALANKSLVAHADPGRVTAIVFTLAAAVALPCASVLAGPISLTPRDLVIVGWLGIVATGVAYLLFSHALRHVSAATGVTLALFEPVTAFVLALVVVGERPGAVAVGGALLVLGGLFVVVWAEVRGTR